MKNMELIDFLKSCEENNEISLIEISEVSDELKEVAKARGIDTDNCDKDFAFFKNVFLPLAKANANGARVFEKDIKPMLATAIGKPVNIDHIRTYTIGHLLDAKIEGDKIITYGLIYKSNFEDEWEEAQKLFKDKKLKSSFEIWCAKENRTYYDDNTFSLDKPVIAGDALLYKSKPAHPEADILEMAKKNIDAKTTSNLLFKDELVAAGIKEEDIITSQYESWDIQAIEKLINQSECPECLNKGWLINKLDFLEQTCEAECFNCGLGVLFKLEASGKVIGGELTSKTENSMLTYKQRQELKDTDFALVFKGKDGNKVRMFPIFDEAHCKNALSRINQSKVQENLKKMGVNIKEVVSKILKKAKQFKIEIDEKKYKSEIVIETKEEFIMDEKIKELEQVISQLKEELEKVKATLVEKENQIKVAEEAKTQMDADVKAKLEAAEAEAAAKIEQAKKDAKIVAERKVELGNFAKDMSDEDLLNEDKFAIARLKMEKATVEAELEKVKNNSTEVAAVRGLNNAGDGNVEATQKRIRQEAWPEKK